MEQAGGGVGGCAGDVAVSFPTIPEGFITHFWCDLHVLWHPMKYEPCAGRAVLMTRWADWPENHVATAGMGRKDPRPVEELLEKEAEL